MEEKWMPNRVPHLFQVSQLWESSVQHPTRASLGEGG